MAVGEPAGLRTLLIDDNPDDRELVKRELRRAFSNLETEEILDAHGFMEALRAYPPDLAITDYQLGWTNGLAVLDAIKDRFPECTVVMFTGTGSEEIAVTALKAGLDDYLLKAPGHCARLPTAVRLGLEHSKPR